MKHLSPSDVSAAILPYEDVPLPEFGPDVVQRVRCLTQLEKDDYDIGFWQPNPAKPGGMVYDGHGARGRLLAVACVNEDGTPTSDVAAWNHFRTDVGERLFEVAQRISGINATVDDLKKALGAVRAGALPTTSPNDSDTPR
jgi:hypothetical protein